MDNMLNMKGIVVVLTEYAITFPLDPGKLYNVILNRIVFRIMSVLRTATNRNTMRA